MFHMSRLVGKIHNFKTFLFFQNNLYNFSRSRFPIVSSSQGDVMWNFRSIDKSDCKLDCLLIQNNPNYHFEWIKKVVSQTQIILLADGGANLFYRDFFYLGSQIHQQILSKVRGVVGDLDSLSDEARNFYQSNKVPIVKEQNDQKNDFQKTLQFGYDLGCRNFLVSGAFGNRLDHTLSTMSITQKIVKKDSSINIILSNSSSLYFPLRSGYIHHIFLNTDVAFQGCGLVTFKDNIKLETKGFKWNLGQANKHQSIEWGKFLSTSNQIVEDQLIIDTRRQHGICYFLATFKQNNLKL